MTGRQALRKGLLLGVFLAFTPLVARELTFDERVRAQEAIERVYYAHQEGATAPFEEAVPREVLESKVRQYLDQSAALAAYWKTPVTDEMLQRELERMARNTRMPDRLLELYAALGNDAFLVKECLARAAVVDRLARNFHSDSNDWDSWWNVARASLRSDLVPLVAATRGVLPGPSAAASWPCAADDTWDNGAMDDAPDGRTFHSAVWTGSVMLIWGGGAYAFPTNTGWRYDPATDTWARIGMASAPAARNEHTAVWTGTEMIVWGGTGTSFTRLNTGARYNPATDVWTAMTTASAPVGRSTHTAVWTGSRMLVWGGQDVNFNRLNSGARYDPATNSWTTMSLVTAPAARGLHSAVWTGSRMVIWGGYTGDNNHLNTGGRYDPAADSWSPTSTANVPSGRSFHTAVWTGSLMLVWGGNVGGFIEATGGRYNPATDAWTPIATVGAPTPRNKHVGVWTGTRLVVWGGQDPNSNVLSSGGQYDPATDAWTPTSTLSAPFGRFSSTAIWTGSLMVVWGGGGYGNLNTGGRYNPASDSWTPTSISNQPAARWAHTAVWTGSRMIVWGGTGEAGQLGNGSRYDPATDAWTPTTALNAPGARADHSAVWTGNRMIVWGGQNAGANLDTGGRYDPVADAWTPTSTTGVPTVRQRHTAVWTGIAMVVWGGHDGNTFHNTGGRYDPVTDNWTPTSLVGAPPSRLFHAAVWTGNVMVVWGGCNGTCSPSSFHGGGGRYDPVTDSWMPLSQTGAPSARISFASAWTGTEVLVWGGLASISYDGVGGRYDPAADSWTLMSSANAPAGRRYPTGVWTGNRFIVWGGGDGNTGPLDTGGRYDPAMDSWTATSALDVPTGRSQHTAVWAGSLMIVSGGHATWNGSTNALSSGGRYVLGATTDDDGDGTSECAGDCNDADAATHPGATEVCNLVDDNCDGVINEGLVRTIYRDVDGDGYGDPAVTQTTCASPAGWVLQSSDCNDSNAAIHPGALEICNDADDDCNGLKDEDALGEDTDVDRVRNRCDNCRTTFNPNQGNFDQDSEGDACDLDDGMIFVFNADKTHRNWQPESGYTSWNRYRGSLQVLRTTGVYTQAPGSNALAGRDCGMTDLSIVDALIPGPGEAAFDLVTGVAAGIESSLGNASGGAPRTNSNPCP